VSRRDMLTIDKPRVRAGQYVMVAAIGVIDGN
jgi:hypothetical protein